MKKTTFFEEDSSVKINSNIKVHPNPAPQKMAIAMAIFEEYNLTKKANRTPKRARTQLSTLQKELLNFYAQEPTEVQMQQVKTFLSQLLKEEIYAAEMPSESKIAA
jgi:hypothetical protein